MKTKTYFCMEDDGNLEYRTLAKNKKDSITLLLRLVYRKGITWQDAQKMGFSCVRVELNKFGQHPDTLKLNKVVAK